MKEIILTKGQVALVDDEDFRLLSSMKWFAVKGKNTFYAVTWTGPWRERKAISMHRFIIGVSDKKKIIDHIDGNGLNNSRINLRESTVAQNSANRKPYGTSKYLGVSATMRGSKKFWRAFIRKKYLGFFDKEIDAAKAYNKAAIKIHGEFANLNKV